MRLVDRHGLRTPSSPGETPAPAVVTCREGQARPPVLCWRASDLAQATWAGLWKRVNELAWLPARPGRVVIQVGLAYRTPVVLETARTLASFLTDRLHCAVAMLDLGSHRNWGSRTPSAKAGEHVLELDGIASSGPLAVPRFWFTPHFLVTVAGTGPSSSARIASVLDAQADVLCHLGNTERRDMLVYEAHRLAPSDLAVACGQGGRSECWWAIGQGDVAVERVIARAAGVDAHDLPRLRGLARHEMLDPMPQVIGSLPPLQSLAAPVWRANTSGYWSRVAAAVRGLTYDVDMVRRNAGKIPGFLRRRLTKGEAA